MSDVYKKANEFADIWNITARRMNQLCAQGIFPGAYKDGRIWMVPADTEKPNIMHKKKKSGLKVQDSEKKVLPCPVGITSFTEVANSCYYVDKTLMLKNMIDDHTKVFLFTRPRRFGKTLTMDMVKTFFEISDEDTSVLFEDKDIWRAGESYRNHQGKYPVIFLTFKDAHRPKWEMMYESLCFTIQEEFHRHIYLLNSEKLTEYEKKYFQKILDGNASETEFQFALGKLSSMLTTHHGIKTIIIIDEYDTPIQQGYLNGYYDEVVSFMRNLFSAALKDNTKLEFGVLTGILRIAKESLFSGLNNLVVNSIMDQRYAEYFGFTTKDVNDISAYYGISEKETEIKDWYNGYRFGTMEIYNPWSVINYIANKCIPKAFWSRTSGNEIVGQLLQSSNQEVANGLTELLKGNAVHSIVDTDIIYPEIEGDADTIYSFLTVSGYLKINGTANFINDIPICSLTIPNREIKTIFQKEILDKLSVIPFNEKGAAP